jgi:hypothetical protein
LSGVEEIGALNVFIAGRRIAVYAIGLYLDAHRVLRWIVSIKRKRTIKRIEPAVNVTDPKMTDLKQDCGMGWVDLEGIRMDNCCPGDGEDTQ